jgi:hypothetical protein
MSKHTALINRLWKGEADRKLAEAFASRFDVPGMAERVPAMLEEAASAADKVAAGQLSVADAQSYLGSFAAEGLGVAPHHMADLSSWFEGTAAEVATAEQPPQPEAQPAPAQPAPPAAATPAQPATSTREQLQQEIARHEANMRAPERSPEWSAYWRSPTAQAAYRSALDVMHGAAEPSLAPGTPEPSSADVRDAIAGTAPPA